jgi:hypothetical protein
LNWVFAAWVQVLWCLRDVQGERDAGADEVEGAALVGGGFGEGGDDGLAVAQVVAGHPPHQQHPVTLNPARLARFADWAKTLPPRPLPRTVIPVPGEYYLDYITRLAQADHLEFLELTDALDDPAAVILDPGRRGCGRPGRSRAGR